jgi:hypothetical protein
VEVRGIGNEMLFNLMVALAVDNSTKKKRRKRRRRKGMSHLHDHLGEHCQGESNVQQTHLYRYIQQGVQHTGCLVEDSLRVVDVVRYGQFGSEEISL